MAARGVVYPDIAAWCACLARATAEISRGRPWNLEWSRLFELLSFARVGVFSNKRSQRKSYSLCFAPTLLTMPFLQYSAIRKKDFGVAMHIAWTRHLLDNREFTSIRLF